jgi:hypothetical protein
MPLFQCKAGFWSGQPGTCVSDANLDDLIFQRIENAEDRPRGIQRDFMLTGPSTKQNGDLQLAVCNNILVHHFQITFLESLLTIFQRCLPLTNQLYFQFESDAEFILDGLLRQLDQCPHLGGLRLAIIDEKVGMLGADHGIANAFSF